MKISDFSNHVELEVINAHKFVNPRKSYTEVTKTDSKSLTGKNSDHEIVQNNTGLCEIEENENSVTESRVRP